MHEATYTDGKDDPLGSTWPRREDDSSFSDNLMDKGIQSINRILYPFAKAVNVRRDPVHPGLK